jgi:uncharacterized protein (DUF433 family)
MNPVIPQQQFLGVGIYSVPEASRLTGVRAARIRRWLVGYSYKTFVGTHISKPVFQKELQPIDGEVALSFLDLIEIRVVNSLRQQNISWKSIRLAEQHAREIFGVDHPFATKKFKTDGRSIFTNLKKKHGEQSLIDLAENQFTFRRFVEPQLKDIEFDPKLQAVRWWPLGMRRQVLLDPQRGFGQPIIPAGVPTSILARAFKRENSAEIVAKWYEIDLKAVRDAVEFEQKLAA